MRPIKLEAEDGEVLTGRLPESWDEVPLLPFARFAATTTVPARIEATAALVGLPAQPLLDDTRHYRDLLRAMPWLSGLPPTGEPVETFTHLGVRYVSAGHLRTLSAGQLEAIYTMQAAYPERPLEAAPGILAVLYVPKGQQLTPELHQASTATLASLPVSVAWPALQDFTANSAASVLNIATFLALSSQVGRVLTEAEQALAMSLGSCLCWQKPLHWAARRLLQSVRRTGMTV